MSTRERIVETAEVLFARHGYAGTSLRDITRAAGVNIAAVNYHFGSKEGLLTEILDRVIDPINQERIQRLDDLEVSGEPTVEDLVVAFLLPDLRALHTLRRRDPALPRFVSRMYTEGSPLMSEVIESQFAEIRRRFGASFARALPDLADADILFRMSCLVGVVVYLFASVETPPLSSLGAGDLTVDIARLAPVATALFTAPVGEVAIG